MPDVNADDQSAAAIRLLGLGLMRHLSQVQRHVLHESVHAGERNVRLDRGDQTSVHAPAPSPGA